jgi:hypothetical protein
MCQGFIQNFAGLVVCRLFLGLFGSASVPGLFSRLLPLILNRFDRTKQARCISYQCTTNVGNYRDVGPSFGPMDSLEELSVEYE